LIVWQLLNFLGHRVCLVADAVKASTNVHGHSRCHICTSTYHRPCI